MSSTFLVQNGRLIVSNATGTLALVSDTEKLRQSIELALQSDKSRLWRLAIVGDIYSIRAEVSRRVTLACNNIQSDQRSRSRISRTPGERLVSIRRIDVNPTNDPRVFELIVSVTSGLGAAASATVTLTRSGRS